MKKFMIFITATALLVAVLPIIGNKLVENTLEDKLSTLNVYGLEVAKAETDAGYFNTKKHYEFLLRDADKFVQYLSQYSDKQIPPYVNAMFEGILVGVDIEYCNFPLSKDVSIDIYPLSFSKNTMHGIKTQDADFHEYLKKFLYSKGVLYHIDYNIVSEDFSGYIKNINESYTLKDGTKVSLKLFDAIFSGNGELIAPNTLVVNIATINAEIDSDKTKLNFSFHDLSSSSSFESQSTYISSGDLKSFKLTVNTSNENLLFDMEGIRATISSNTQGDKAELYAKNSLQRVSIKSNAMDALVKNFTSDIAINGLDKDSFEELRILVSRSKASSASVLQKELQDSMVKLLSKGLKLEIARFSLENITLNTREDLDGFEIKSIVKIKEDKDLASKIKSAPLLVSQNVDITLNIKISKTLYAKLTHNMPIASMADVYAKEEGNSVVFDLSFINSKFKINGKRLR